MKKRRKSTAATVAASHSPLPADFCLEGLRGAQPDFRVLYKYQRITDYSLDSLRRRYLYFSSYHQLNDPFDPFLTLISHEAGEVSRLISDKGIKIFCVTEDDNNPLMWAHYAGAGSGMCIGYAVFVGNPRIFHPVRYVNEIGGDGYSPLDFMTMKSAAWQWEAEWRACFPGNQHEFTDLAHPVSICLGPRCSTADMELVRAAMPKTVSAFQIRFPEIKEGRFAYAIHDVDAILKEYGEIPRLEDLYRIRWVQPGT